LISSRRTRLVHDAPATEMEACARCDARKLRQHIPRSCACAEELFVSAWKCGGRHALSNGVFVFDGQTPRLLWAWGHDEVDGPHDATILENGNILLFDNGRSRGWSRVLEVDPLTRKVVWEFRARDGDSFFSLSRGSRRGCQRQHAGVQLELRASRGGQQGRPSSLGFQHPITNENGNRAVMIRLRRLWGPWIESLVGRRRNSSERAPVRFSAAGVFFER